MTTSKKIEKKADSIIESTVGKLVKMVEDQLAQKRKEIAELEKQQRAEFEGLIKREEELKEHLKAERAIAEKMIVEYKEIEKKTEEKTTQEIEMKTLKEQDVKEGRISIQEFLKSGKTKKERFELSIAQAQKELIEVLRLIRQKNVEILSLERELAQVQDRIFHLAVYPLRNLERAFESTRDFCDFQMGHLIGQMSEAETKLGQLEIQFQLVEKGQALSSGHVWRDLTLDEARRVEFDPVLPERHVQTLKSRLKEFEGQKNVRLNVEWYWKGDEFYVESPYIEMGERPLAELKRITDTDDDESKDEREF